MKLNQASLLTMYGLAGLLGLETIVASCPYSTKRLTKSFRLLAPSSS